MQITDDMVNAAIRQLGFTPADSVRMRAALEAALVPHASQSSVDADPLPSNSVDDSADDLTAAYMAGFERGKEASRNQALEDAAKLIDANQIADTSSGQIVEPRIDGNRAGMAFANAIRSLKERTDG